MATEHIHAAITRHFADPAARVVVGAPGSRRAIVLSPSDLPNLKPEGTGLRFGRLYLFACQLRFARAA